ncbi:MAG: hypothetical protein ABIO44_04625 [Saprospiraceae bacterium]
MIIRLAFLISVNLLVLSNIIFCQEKVKEDISLIAFAKFAIGAPSRNFPAGFTCGLSLGFHHEFKISKDFHIDFAYQPSFTLYQRGFGTSILEYSITDENLVQDKIIKQSSSSQIDLINSFSLTFGGAKKDSTIALENRTFHIFHKSPLILNYNSSLSLGTNFITNFNGRNQQIGFIRVNIWKAELAYYNDGTPFQYILTGDGKDRWWTGGGYFQYGNDRVIDTSLKNKFSFALGFDRFTGYSHGMFELGNLLKQSIVLHKDPRQYFLNSGRNYLMISDLKNNFNINLSANNIPWIDIQNLIHNSGSMSKHYSLLKESYSLGVAGYYPFKL